MIRAALASALLATPAFADEDFVEANLIGIFYHELGHAVIDIEAVPIFGQEEDAADAFSIFMIDTIFDEDASIELASDAAFGFWGEVEMRDYDLSEIPWWDEHGPDEQRYFNTVCLFYGADPEAREAFAQDGGLPEERAELCPFEYDLANASWGSVLEEMLGRGGGTSITFRGDDSLTSQVIAEEVSYLNGVLTLSHPLTVVIDTCGEANAFYDLEAREVVMCLEFEDHLFEMADLLSES